MYRRMQTYYNSLNQLVGFPMRDWQPCLHPPHTPMQGRTCRLEPLNPERHAQSLYAANSAATDDGDWTYLPYGPYDSLEAYTAWQQAVYLGKDPQFYAIIDLASGEAVGVASYLRINPKQGSIEVGHIHFSRQLQKTPIATEAMYLMMKRAFDELGYRRYEWKCDALNAPSRAAAQRLGFSYEGTFRQALMYKGRNRDTAWFSILDTEWPQLKAAYEGWLHPDNFDAQGQQKMRLADWQAR